MLKSFVSFIKSFFENSNIRCYFKSDCCNRTQASNPQEIKSKISRIITLWNLREKHKHKHINKIKVAGELCSPHERLILSAHVPWRKEITT